MDAALADEIIFTTYDKLAAYCGPVEAGRAMIKGAIAIVLEGSDCDLCRLQELEGLIEYAESLIDALRERAH